MLRPRRLQARLSVVLVSIAGVLAAAPHDIPPREPDTKRAEVFAFVQKPKVSGAGDRITIEFETKDSCDCTVAIENSKGRIVRHLACGVLGVDAPLPFRKNSLKQGLVWDGKDDHGTYIDDRSDLQVRVSLGLKAQFERTLHWSPYKRSGDPKGIGRQPSLVACTPDGAYVYDAGDHDHVLFFNHKGEYVRTVYPFPAKDLAGVDNLKWHTFAQDGARRALKWGLTQYTLLTSGNLAYGKGWPGAGAGDAATAMAVHNGELYLVNQRLNKLAIRGKPNLAVGPRTSIPLTVKDAVPGREFTREFFVAPRNCAVSPDGKWLYFTSFNYRAYFRSYALHGVARVALDKDAEPELFAGVLLAAKKGMGSDDTHFTMPCSVACDSKGRVYVADWANDRIQIYSPEAKLLKSIRTKHPTRIRIHPRTDELYVFTWPITCAAISRQMSGAVKPNLVKLGTFEKPGVLEKYDLPLDKGHLGGNTRIAEADIDFWTTPPTIWFASNKPISYRASPLDGMHMRLLQPEGGELVEKRHFAKEARKAVVRLRGPRHVRQRLFVNPKDGHLYVGEHHDPAAIHVKSITELIVIDPQTGKGRLSRMPFDAEDMAFDMNGLVYLRTLDTIARYDPRTWREVPFDYGEQRKKHGYHPVKWTDVTSVISAVARNNSSSQMYGMGVSPKGHVFATFINPPEKSNRTSQAGDAHVSTTREYKAPIYPGKGGHVDVHVWDKHGKLVYEDAIPGLGRATGIGMDKDDNFYVLSAACVIRNGKQHFNDTTGTLFKVKPGKARFLATRATIPLKGATRPKRPPDLRKGDIGRSWLVNVEWIRGGVGMDTKCLNSASRDCHCVGTSRFDLDYFARSFVPEIDRNSVLVLDANGNQVLRIGTYGNVDDGVPLVGAGGPAKPRSVGGDEVALFWGNHVATHTDHRLFIADPGNGRILSVKLGYHAEERVRLR